MASFRLYVNYNLNNYLNQMTIFGFLCYAAFQMGNELFISHKLIFFLILKYKVRFELFTIQWNFQQGKLPVETVRSLLLSQLAEKIKF